MRKHAQYSAVYIAHEPSKVTHPPPPPAQAAAMVMPALLLITHEVCALRGHTIVCFVSCGAKARHVLLRPGQAAALLRGERVVDLPALCKLGDALMQQSLKVGYWLALALALARVCALT